MRKLLSIFAAAGLALSMAGTASAEPIPYVGTLQVGLGTLPALVVSGTGVATVNASGGLGHLTTLTNGNNGLQGTATLPLTDPANPTLVSLVGTFGLGTGTFVGISGGGGPNGSVAVSGLFRLCIILGPGCPFSIAIPLTENGTRGAGLGGLITISGFAKAGIKISIFGNPWTVGTATISLLPTDNGGFTTSTAFGFAHGPNSVTSSTGKASGVVQLVTPTRVETNIMGSEALALFSTLTIHFTPEPGTLLLVGSGLAGIAMASRRRKK